VLFIGYSAITPATLLALALLALGSGFCGNATSLPLLIAGRTIQALGGGAIESLSNVVIADMVVSQERGLSLGLIGLIWSIAALIGPIAGGSLAEEDQWRW
jgi:MFS family permease